MDRLVKFGLISFAVGVTLSVFGYLVSREIPIDLDDLDLSHLDDEDEWA